MTRSGGRNASPICIGRRCAANCACANWCARLQRPQSRIKAFSVEPRVIIDNDSSNRYTVIEINGLDRIGLLHDLTEALFGLNLNIASAHITTFGEKAVDVFYVTDLTGGKITSAQPAEADREGIDERRSPRLPRSQAS